MKKRQVLGCIRTLARMLVVVFCFGNPLAAIARDCFAGFMGANIVNLPAGTFTVDPGATDGQLITTVNVSVTINKNLCRTGPLGAPVPDPLTPEYFVFTIFGLAPTVGDGYHPTSINGIAYRVRSGTNSLGSTAGIYAGDSLDYPFVSGGASCANGSASCGLPINPSAIDGNTYSFVVELVKYGVVTDVGTVHFGPFDMGLGFKSCEAGACGNAVQAIFISDLAGFVLTISPPNKCDLDIIGNPRTIQVDFGNVSPGNKPIGSIVGPDMLFGVKFKSCQGSPAPKLTFSRFADDASVVAGDYALKTLVAGNPVDTGLAFQIFNANPTLSSTPLNPDVSIQKSIPAGQTSYVWPFHVRLFKRSSTVQPGAFSGHSRLTIEWL